MGEKWINDRVHGGIKLTDGEVEILNTPIFQRLRHLRQLSLLHYVFPGAEHTRFQHALGTLHMMHLMMQRLSLNINDEDARHLRAAAMLHDLGHYPFSHLGEYAYAAAAAATSSARIFEENSDRPVSKLVTALRSIEGAKDLHERLGQLLITYRRDLQAALGRGGLDPDKVAAFLRHEYERSFHFRQMLHSDLDCDRLDYLVRDATGAGVRYGLVDVDYIIHSLKLIRYNPRRDEGDWLLAIDAKGIPAVEHYLIARFLHYKGVVYHKTVAAFEVVARAVLLDMLRYGFLSPFDSIT